MKSGYGAELCTGPSATVLDSMGKTILDNHAFCNSFKLVIFIPCYV